MSKTAFALLAATFALSNVALAYEYKVGDLQIGHPFTFETTAMARSAGGFMTVTNTGNTADRLIEVKGDFPRVEMHITEMTDGVARMMKQDFIEIPPGETVTFQQGSYHVMLMGLNEPFNLGQEFPLTLVFEEAGTIDVIFNVEARPTGGMQMDHSNHGTRN